MNLYQSQTIEVKASEQSFTMIIMDLDDTLIPTSIRQYLFKNFDIDIFQLKHRKTKLLKRLQLSIIDTLQNIKENLSKIGHVEIALVSNGSAKWLKQMFLIKDEKDEKDEKDRLNKNNKNVHLNLLSKYFNENNISIHSAVHENIDLIKANPELKRNNDNKPKNKRWILKYTTIESIIKQKTNELMIPCKKIISFGDGQNEKKAMKHYSSTFGVQCIHFAFIKAPSIYQLNQQWKLIKNRVDIQSLTTMNYFVFKMNEKIPNDNNEDCIGKTHQLPSIQIYFAHWIKGLNCTKSQYRSKIKLNTLAQKIISRKMVMERNKKYNGSPYQTIVHVLCVVHPELGLLLKSLRFE